MSRSNVWAVIALVSLIPLWLWGAVPDFSGARAYDYLVAQCDFGPRNPGSEAHQECATWLFDTLRSFTNDVEQQYFSYKIDLTGDTPNLVNIIARFQSSQRDRVVIGAHWDTRPIAEFDPDPAKRDTPILGANDGASGVAVILELARIFSENPPPVGIELVLFDAEDSGEHNDLNSWCIGSRYYGMHLTGELPRWGIVLDMIGEKNAVYSMELNSLELAPRLTRTLWHLAGELDLIQFDPSRGPTVWDDHMMLNKYGIPTVDIIDFEYLYWHTTEDTPDKCSAESLGSVGTLLVHWIYDGAQVSP
jgi:glutaminyl-peptide cyclotransferase